MVLDHIAEFSIFRSAHVFHWIGRIAAPIFFLKPEGFVHTRNRKIYVSFISRFLADGNYQYDFESLFCGWDAIVINNIFGTLFLGTVCASMRIY